MGMKSFRLREMEHYILERGTVSMDQLRRNFNISMNTVRMDVAQLVNKGTVRKVYGGVCSHEKSNLVPFEERQLKHIDGKKAVGKAAAALVEDGDIIYIDSGTTTMHVVDFLKDTRDVTILTNNLNAINRALIHENLTVISMAGTLERKTNSFVSADVVKTLKKYNIRKAFMATSGITEDGMVTNSSPLEFEIKQAAIAGSREIYLLIDSGKYKRSALLTYATIEDADAVVTDDGITDEFLSLCREHDVEVLVGQREAEECHDRE